MQKGAALMWLIMRRDAGGLDGGGGWLIWWLEGAEQGWSVAALLWPAACMRKKEGEESWLYLFLCNLLMVILVGCWPKYV